MLSIEDVVFVTKIVGTAGVERGVKGWGLVAPHLALLNFDVDRSR